MALYSFTLRTVAEPLIELAEGRNEERRKKRERDLNVYSTERQIYFLRLKLPLSSLHSHHESSISLPITAQQSS